MGEIRDSTHSLGGMMKMKMMMVAGKGGRGRDRGMRLEEWERRWIGIGHVVLADCMTPNEANQELRDSRNLMSIRYSGKNHRFSPDSGIHGQTRKETISAAAECGIPILVRFFLMRQIGRSVVVVSVVFHN